MQSPLTVKSAILTRTQFRGRLGKTLLETIEAILEGNDPNLAATRRSLRVAKDDLLAAGEVNLLYPPTRTGVLGLAVGGLTTMAHAQRVLSVPAGDIPPMVEQPAGTIDALWNGWPVWASQCPDGEAWPVQTPEGDVIVTAPDYLIIMQMGGATYRAAPSEIEPV